jgi:hypothetical protein
MSLKTVFAVLFAMALGALGYALWARKGEGESPLLVMVTQVRTRAIVEHERQVTVWYKACPEVMGKNPEVMVIWPAKLNYELDLTQTKLSLAGDVLKVTTPPIRADDPSIPTEAGEYLAQTSFWTLENEQTLVMREMQKATPLARHLTSYFLHHDVGLSSYFREELDTYLRGIAGALAVKISRIEIEIPQERVPILPRPPLALCEGTLALANGMGFARRQDDGAIVTVNPSREAPKPPPAPTATPPATPAATH